MTRRVFWIDRRGDGNVLADGERERDIKVLQNSPEAYRDRVRKNGSKDITCEEGLPGCWYSTRSRIRHDFMGLAH